MFNKKCVWKEGYVYKICIEGSLMTSEIQLNYLLSTSYSKCLKKCLKNTFLNNLNCFAISGKGVLLSFFKKIEIL